MTNNHPKHNQDWNAGYIAGSRDSGASAGRASVVVVIIVLLLVGVIIGWILASIGAAH